MAKRTPETVDQAVCRLAVEAKKKGVQIFLYPRIGEWYATSTSSPDQLHRVTLVSCDCPGFVRHQRCTRHSDLLAELGELPPLPAPPPPPSPILLTPLGREDGPGVHPPRGS